MVGVKTKLFEGLKSIGRFWVLEVLDFSQVGLGPTGSSVEGGFWGPLGFISGFGFGQVSSRL